MTTALDAVKSQAPTRAVEEACGRIPPLWPLQNFVASNPFLGLMDLPFGEAAALLLRVTPGGMLMDAAYYVRNIRDGVIQAEDVPVPLDRLTQQLQENDGYQPMATVADWLDAGNEGGWAEFVTDEISKWCSSYFDHGQSAWAMPWSDQPLYTAWRAAARLDANPEVAGLAGFRQFVSRLPESADECVAEIMESLALPPERQADFLHRELMSVFGWSAYCAFQDRQGAAPRMLPQLLAIRLAYDAALRSSDRRWTFTGAPAGNSAVTEAKCVAQAGLELAFRRKLAALIRPAAIPAPSTRKALQAVFCIDVRSEVYRRALEAESPKFQTVGFAGFFGMPIALGDSARCPVLLQPAHRVESSPAANGVGRRLARALQVLRSSAVACFPTVEVTGVWYGFKMWQRAWRTVGAIEPESALRWQLPLATQVDWAAGALKNMSLDPRELAPIVLLCGHGGQTENNPYASSLDCGACGGHKGDVNARFAATILNDPEVRLGLLDRGVAIPGDTVFAAALHNTTTDEVVLFENPKLDDQQRTDLQRWLQAASRRARLLRNPELPAGTADKTVKARSTSWAEVRPEWGLAGNAAFVAAPRARTRGADLGGRVFLHDYDRTADADGAVLTLILTAPVVVASWINLQYYGSTVNNRLFGSGNKVLHNVVGRFGVWEGNAGDLRTGLPMQSLHDGARWRHEPLRLQVIVDAPRDRIDQVLRSNADIRKLVTNQWIHLVALEGQSYSICRGPGDWS